MAALYLHQALFPSDTTPPTIAQRPSRVFQGRPLPSLSSVTLHTASESSHASASLVDNYADSPTYQDLLSRQPLHPFEAAASSLNELTFQGDPITDRERRRRWEAVVRKRLRRLRWARRLLTIVIVAWAMYNAIRYFVAFTVYSSHKRQVTLLVLGSAAMLSFACTSSSQLLALFAPRFGWKHSARSIYGRVQGLLCCTSSLLLLGPALVNFALVFAWKDTADSSDSVEGRCHWDIDVAWSGTGRQCAAPEAVSWGYWLVGSLVRLLITALVLAAYHYVSYVYAITRRPSRKHLGRTHAHSISYRSSAEAFLRAPSVRSSHTMFSTATAPASIPRPLPHPSRSTSEGDLTQESSPGSSASGHRTLRRSASRISIEPQSTGDGRVKHGRLSSSGRSQSSSNNLPSRADELAQVSFNSSEEDLSHMSEPGALTSSYYGRPLRSSSGAYTVIPPSALALEHLAEPPVSVQPDSESRMSLERFRDLLEEVQRETEEAIRFAQNDQSGSYAGEGLSPIGSYEPFPLEEDEDDYVPVVGRMVQRMPTIESLGSREVMSLSSLQRGDRSIHSLSRPPTRANTLSIQEATGSQPVSRSNSLTASFVLSSPADGQPPVNEIGEFGPRSLHARTGSQQGSKSTASYYTAVGSSSSSADNAAFR